MANMENGEIMTRKIPPPESMNGEEVHFSWVTFASENRFAVQWMNRVQNKTVITICKTTGMPDCQEVFAYEVENGWVDYTYRIFFDPNYKDESGLPSFVTILSSPTKPEKFRQVLLSLSKDKRTYLTNFNADVLKILSWSPDGYIYFLANLEGNPTSQHLFKVAIPSDDVNSDNLEPICITCKMEIEDDLHKRKCK